LKNLRFKSSVDFTNKVTKKVQILQSKNYQPSFMKYFTPCLFLISGFLLNGCGSEQSEDVSDKSTIAFRQFKDQYKTGPCAGDDSPCFEIVFSYPEVEQGPLIFRNAFGFEMATLLQTKMNDFLADPLQADNNEAFIKQLFAEYNTYLEQSNGEFGGMNKWIISIHIEPLYQTDELISLSIETYSYTGGAHPDQFITFKNFFLPSMETCELADLVSDEAALLKDAESIFRNKYKIPEGSSFSDKGYWFENDAFSLPDNFGISSTGLIFRYNPYDIGPYAIGAHEVKVPFEVAKPYIK